MTLRFNNARFLGLVLAVGLVAIGAPALAGGKGGGKGGGGGEGGGDETPPPAYSIIELPQLYNPLHITNRNVDGEVLVVGESLEEAAFAVIDKVTGEVVDGGFLPEPSDNASEGLGSVAQDANTNHMIVGSGHRYTESNTEEQVPLSWTLGDRPGDGRVTHVL